MTTWIDFFVYTVFILSFFVVTPWAYGKLAVPMLADRNSDWVKKNPKALLNMKRFGDWVFWIHCAFGIVSLVVLAMIQLQLLTASDWPEKLILRMQLSSLAGPDSLSAQWMLLTQFSMLSLFIGMLLFTTLGLLWYVVWVRKVPIAERRQANLQRRSIHDFVPLTVRLVTYLLVFLNLTAWVVVAFLGWHDDPLFWQRLVFMFFGSGFFWLATAGAIARRPNVMDRMFGSGYRRGEVLLTFLCHLLLVATGVARIYEELADVIVFNINRGMFLGIVLYVIVWMLWIGYLVASNLLPSKGVDSKLINNQ